MPNVLVLLWGPPASGKSSLVKRLGLEPYTVSFDRMRELFSPALPSSGGPVRPMPYRTVQKAAVDATFSQAESLMSLGSFVVVDNTNIKGRDRKPWNDLARRYGYDVMVVDALGDLPVETLEERDALREPLKRVGPEVIRKKHAEATKNPSEKNSFWDIPTFEYWLRSHQLFANRLFMDDDARPIHIVGDIHSHAEPLANAMAALDPDLEDRWVFLGDLFDRGPDPVGVYDLVYTLPHPHVIIGNHDRTLIRLNADPGDGKGAHQTRDTLEKLTNAKRNIPALYRDAHAWVTIENTDNEHTYFLSHGGVPPEYFSFFTPDHLFINGYSSKEDTYRGGTSYRSMGDMSDELEYVIHGHRKYDREGNTISLDTEGNGTVMVATINPNEPEPTIERYGYVTE